MATTNRVKKMLELSTHSTEWVTIDEMDRAPFQRPLDERRAESIGADLNPDAFGVITLSRRPNGRYVILDGQHRVQALRSIGWNGQKIECHVFTGLTPAAEAQRFIQLNNFKGLRYIDKFLSRIEAHDPAAVQIAKIVQDAGYAVDRTQRDGTITAAKALEDVYLGRGQKIKGVNPAALRLTLKVVTDAWGHTTSAVNGQVLAGVGAFCLRYGKAVNAERLAEKLRKMSGGPEGLIQRGAGKRELHGGTIPFGIAHHLVEVYNRGLGPRSKERLQGWRSSESGE
jgi:hypothetical protein